MTNRPYNRIEKRIMEHMMAEKEALANTAYGENHLDLFGEADEELKELKAKADKDDYNHEGTKEYFKNLYTGRVEEIKQQTGFYDKIGQMHKEADAEAMAIEGPTFDEAATPFEPSLFAQKYLNAETNFHGDFDKLDADAKDEIINPKHYKMIPPEAYTLNPEGLEYMDLMVYLLETHSGVQAHLLGQIYKYACRLGKKDSKLQDASKIAWYAERLVKEIENAE